MVEREDPGNEVTSLEYLGLQDATLIALENNLHKMVVVTSCENASQLI